MGMLERLRLGLLTKSMAVASRKRSSVTVSGIHLTVAPGVCHPAPAMGLSFARLFEAALEDMSPAERVLDVGTGTGVWALMASRAGATVTATDLPHVPLDVIRQTAEENGIVCPDLRHGSLFDRVVGERFDRVLFNPPFHFGEPRNDAERATLGGADGEVVKGFLDGLAAHLAPGGAGYLILPERERARYPSRMNEVRVEPQVSLTIPVLGRVWLLRMRHG